MKALMSQTQQHTLARKQEGSRGQTGGVDIQLLKTHGKVLAYWVLTASLAVVLMAGAYGELTHQWGTLQTHTILGYPLYFLDLIGLWKALAGIAILVPRFPRLKEWAYAGLFFNMTGAFISHAVVGDYGSGAYHLIATGSMVVLVVASWALRPPSRTLGKRTGRMLKGV